MKLIDTHAHLNFAAFDADRETVIENSLAEGIFAINVGVNFESSRAAATIAQKYETGVWAAIGLHPENIKNISEEGRADAGEGIALENIKEPGFDSESYRRLAQTFGKIVAIGETGLDYLRLPKNAVRAEKIRANQKEVFKKQLALAKDLDLPVIVHSRMAHDDMMAALKEFAGAKGYVRGVMHCFSGTAGEAREIYGLGMCFGLNGIIFKLNLDEAVKQMPLDRILLETDCPYLSPLPQIKRNEPRHVLEVAKRVAAIRNEPAETIIAAATENARSLFGIEIDQTRL